MARFTFGASSGDLVTQAASSNSGIIKAAANYSSVGTFWSAQTGGTQYTDLVDPNNGFVAITGISTDANGRPKQFQGPDGVYEGWLDFGGGRFKITATESGQFTTSAGLDTSMASLVNTGGSATDVALKANYSRKNRIYHLDAYNAFFGGAANTFATGQVYANTTLTASAASGTNTLAVAAGANYPNGTVLLTEPGTANQQLYRITAGGGTNTLTVTPNVVNPLGSGAPIGPLWFNVNHLTNNGWASFAYFIANAKDAQGNYILSGGKITLLGDSWFFQGGTAYATAINARLPGATVVNAGISGDTSAMMLARFGTDVPTDSKFVILNEPGVNDVYTSVLPATIAANLEKLVSKIIGIGAIPIFTGMPPLIDYPTGSAARRNELAAQIGDGTAFPGAPASAVARIISPDAATVGIGTNNLSLVTTGIQNTAFGSSALATASTGTACTAVGQQSMFALTIGSFNTALGSESLLTVVSGGNNVAVGQAAARALTGSGMTAIGQAAARNATTGTDSVFVGKSTGYAPNNVTGNATTTGIQQTVVGAEAGQGSSTQVNGITAIGRRALASGTSAVAVGTLANAGANYATAVGASASAAAAGSTAIGTDSTGTGASTATSDEMALGTGLTRVKVAGRLNVANRTPTSSADAQGAQGDIATDDNYVYVKTSTGWKRSALTTF